MGPVITLTTDFGTRDWFVGAMKGVILGINPTAQLVDLTHEIPAGDICAGAFAVAAASRFFPKGTIHVAVVDPGVGSARRAIGVQTTNAYFIGPDNGLLSWALRREKIVALRALHNEKYFLKPVSQTFHGRDVFAPVAAHLSCGVPLREFGPALKNFVRLDWPEPRQVETRLEGEVVYVDRFGNAITNIENASLGPSGFGRWEILHRGKRVCAMADHYQAVSKGKLVAVPGSSGFLEVAINGDNAAQKLRLRVGDRVIVKRISSRAD